MRATITLTIGFLAAASAAHAAPSNKSCVVCHTAPQFDPDALPNSVHKKLDCADCHKGYDFHLHRAKAPEWKPQEKELLKKFDSLNKYSAPAALVACTRCHDAQRDDWLGSVHGQWVNEKKPINGPTCLECHGNPHTIKKASKDPAAVLAARKDQAARCSKCHEDPELVKKAKLSTHPAPSYRDSVHGRMNALGNPAAPSCVSCHSAHDIAKVSSPDSPVNEKNKVKTCAECHKGANANFAGTFTHEPRTGKTRPIPHLVELFFSWLTALTLTILFIHVILDFGSEIRTWRARRAGELPAHKPTEKAVQRLDIHQRAQHWIMLSSILVLVVTDFPVRAAGVYTSQAMANWFGGVHKAGVIHRWAGMAMGLSGLYHLIYLTWLGIKNKLPFSMVPSLKDAQDIKDNIAYFFGQRKERPRFPKFTYFEKFDYWAVFWGVAIMFGTGLVRWFPVFFAKFLPASILESAQIAHGDEATLAALVLFVWHLYNVHLKPSVFPMSWIWLDGKMDLHQLEDEHGDEYDTLAKAGKLPTEKP